MDGVGHPLQVLDYLGFDQLGTLGAHRRFEVDDLLEAKKIALGQ
jgi:hypothetical protein